MRLAHRPAFTADWQTVWVSTQHPCVCVRSGAPEKPKSCFHEALPALRLLSRRWGGINRLHAQRPAKRRDHGVAKTSILQLKGASSEDTTVMNCVNYGASMSTGFMTNWPPRPPKLKQLKTEWLTDWLTQHLTRHLKKHWSQPWRMETPPYPRFPLALIQKHLIWTHSLRFHPYRPFVYFTSKFQLFQKVTR